MTPPPSGMEPNAAPAPIVNAVPAARPSQTLREPRRMLIALLQFVRCDPWSAATAARANEKGSVVGITSRPPGAATLADPDVSVQRAPDRHAHGVEWNERR